MFPGSRVGPIRPKCNRNCLSATEVNRRNAYILLICCIGRNGTANFSRDPADAVDQGGGVAVAGRICCLGSGTIVKSPITDRSLRVGRSDEENNGEREASDLHEFMTPVKGVLIGHSHLIL